MDFQSLLLCMGLIALAELGDKTMVTTIALTLRYGALNAITLSIAAFTTSTIIVALNANWLTLVVSPNIMKLVASLAFITLGIIMFMESFKTGVKAQEIDKIGGLRCVVLYGTLLLAELGDKTQLGVFSLAVSVGLIPTIIGGIAGYLLVNSAAVIMSKLLKRRLSMRLAMRISSIIFIAVGTSMAILTLKGAY